MPRLPYRVLTGPLRGLRFILGSMAGDGGGASAYFNLVEPRQTELIAADLVEGSVFFDIGANVGFYTVLSSRLVGEHGHVIACEPSIRNLSFLYRHLEYNSLSNVRVIAFACSDENTIASFSTGTNPATGHIDAGEGQNENAQLIPTITIDTLVEKIGRIPDVMKIDVEGAELRVLNGGRRTLIDGRPIIFLSTHSAELRSECINFLTGIGYQVKPMILGDDCHEFRASID